MLHFILGWIAICLILVVILTPYVLARGAFLDAYFNRKSRAGWQRLQDTRSQATADAWHRERDREASRHSFSRSA